MKFIHFINEAEETLRNIEKKWKDVFLVVHEINNAPKGFDGSIILEGIKVNEEEQGKGIGSKVMKDLTDYADKMNFIMQLTPSLDMGAKSISMLKEFYKRFGFVDNNDKYKFLIEDTMIRLPKKGIKINEEIENLKLVPLDMKYIKSIDPNDLGGVGIIKNKNYEHKFFTVMSDDIKVGGVGITNINGKSFLQIVVDPKFRNQNLFQKFVNLVMDKLNINILFSKVFKNNVPSKKAHNKAGFIEIYNEPEKDFIYYKFERS